MPIVKELNVNPIELHKSYGGSLVARFCNCVKNNQDEFAKEFPEVTEVDENFPLPALYRLGDYSVVNTEFGSILNFYTKLYDNDKLEYSALASCLKKLSMESIKSGMYIELIVGFEEDQENLEIIKKILNYQQQLLITLLIYDQGQVSMGQEQVESAP